MMKKCFGPWAYLSFNLCLVGQIQVKYGHSTLIMWHFSGVARFFIQIKNLRLIVRKQQRPFWQQHAVLGETFTPLPPKKGKKMRW